PFLLAPEVNANPLLSDSWSRCQRYGLDPATEEFLRLDAGEPADRLASHRSLQQLAPPVVEAQSGQVADLQSVVILSDPDGLVLHTLGDTQALQKAQLVALAPGHLWSESGSGTTAIGIALAIDAGCV
ncbi:sigma-54-dependent Fis family transcriptional regulator, partial [Escherichia coli]